ncbi:MAG: sce7726 family protein [Clostridia bacterium]|nr:sce7726 family protein [Clostridia bacterium]
MRTYDKNIRPLLFDYLDERYGKIRTFEELCIGRSRADVLAVTDGALIGLEIKSDADSYARLAAQVKDYDRYCDYCFLVSGERHGGHAAEHLPDYWGLLLVVLRRDSASVTEARGAAPVPRDKLRRQLSLLWRRELSLLLQMNNCPKYAGKSRKFVTDKLLEKVPRDRLKRQLCELLFERDYTVFGED